MCAYRDARSHRSDFRPSSFASRPSSDGTAKETVAEPRGAGGSAMITDAPGSAGPASAARAYQQRPPPSPAPSSTSSSSSSPTGRRSSSANALSFVPHSSHMISGRTPCIGCHRIGREPTHFFARLAQQQQQQHRDTNAAFEPRSRRFASTAAGATLVSMARGQARDPAAAVRLGA
jgi:hypothetical protein